MITAGSKYLYGSAVLALLGAFLLALATSGHSIGMSSLTGAVSFGYKGGVGAHFGYTLLVAYAGLALFLGGVLSVVRDADPEVGAALLGLDEPAPVMPPRGVSYWPIVAAFGAALTMVGLIFDSALFALGLVLVGIAAIEWTIGTWADQATGDHATNRHLRSRLLGPIEVPLAAILGIAVFVFALSRVLLAFPKVPGAVIFGVVPAVAFLVAILLNSKPQWTRGLITVVVVVGALVVLGGGIFGLVRGSEHIEKETPSQHLYKIKGVSSAPLQNPFVLKEGIR